ncbi:MAG: hypothetical protein IT371_23650 [Deltaproteobacteria bacterium]|nr:hypothetical protein [Deltaproteobacteria bacterium]
MTFDPKTFDRQTWQLVFALAGVFVWLAVWMLWATLRVGRAARRAATAFREGERLPDDDLASRLFHRLKDHLVLDLGPTQPRRFVTDRAISVSLDDTIDAWLDRRLAFAMGPALTGLALICTFALIAWVLVSDVSGAINEMGQATRSGGPGTKLSSAVSHLGAKFAISATGVSCSILHLFLARLLRRRAHHTAAALASELDALCVPLERFKLEQGAETQRAMQLRLVRMEQALEQSLRVMQAEQSATEARHESSALWVHDLMSRIADVESSVRKLSSIEVSVKDMGTQVTDGLSKMMKQSLASELHGMAQQMLGAMDDMAERLRAVLTETLAQEMAATRGALEAIRTSVQSQGQSQLDAIIDNLRDVLAGGFRSESAGMADGLRRFAEVVPELATQLRAITAEVAEDLRRRTAENSDATAAVMERVTDLLASLEAQQAATSEAIERIWAASAQGADLASTRIAEGSEAVLHRMISTSGREVESIMGMLRGAANESALQTGALNTQLAEIAASVSTARDGLGAASRELGEMAARVQQVLAGAHREAELTRTILGTFQQSAQTLADATRDATDLSTRLAERASEQQALIEAQRAYGREVERVWPQLFDTYLSRFEQQSSALSAAWKGQADDVEKVIRRVSESFASSVTDLGDSLEQLERTVSKLGATR